jgi:hypothetical protein
VALASALSVVGALLLAVGWAVSERAAWAERRPDVVEQLATVCEEVADRRPFAALRHLELLTLQYGPHPLFAQLQDRVRDHIAQPLIRSTTSDYMLDTMR